MLARLPVIASLIGMLALGMLVPAIKAASESDWQEARGFLYASVFCLFVAAALAVLLRPMSSREFARHELSTLLLAWVLLPAFAALPLVLLTPQIGLLGAWFEMVAALTTTGGSIYPDLGAVPEPVHLWRGLVGWFGGFLTLLGAYVILAPRRLGGFEVMAAGAESFTEGRSVDLRLPSAPFEHRLNRALRTIVPAYLLMTAALAIALNALAEPGLQAALHAMAIVSTSGISTSREGLAGASNFYAEAVTAVFLVLAATRLFYSGASQIGQRVDLRTDPELRLMAVLVGLSTLALFLRHWLGVLVIRTGGSLETELLEAFAALWGAAFTSLSFLTTTGFHSAAWDSARDWSGLANPGLILLALCAIGGGAATTAGGVKLIRAFAMLRHAGRELQRIAKPHSVAGAGLGSRGLRREGAMIAWAFMMLFSLAFVGTILLLTLTGMEMMEALVAATAALSNTGPAYALISGEAERSFALLGGVHQIVLAAAMVLGRIETLAAIVLLHPESWAHHVPHAKRTGKTDPESPLSRW
jgi:trk system potassium uptake protein TrkH